MQVTSTFLHCYKVYQLHSGWFQGLPRTKKTAARRPVQLSRAVLTAGSSPAGTSEREEKQGTAQVTHAQLHAVAPPLGPLSCRLHSQEVPPLSEL